MQDGDKNIEADFLGDAEPLQARRTPAESDRRGISFRWFGGSIMTGLASVSLMGGALYTALDGRENLAIPAQAYEKEDPENGTGAARIEKSGRPYLTAALPETPEPGKVFMVPTVTREGDQDVVKLKPFMHLDLPLAAVPRREVDYPRFDPLAIFSENGKAEPIAYTAEQIYGADVEGEISLKIEPYPLGDPNISVVSRQTSEDIESIVRNTAPTLDVGGTALTSVPYFDAARFSAEDSSVLSTPGLTITAENVSVISRVDPEAYPGMRYLERKAAVKSELPIALVLQGEGLGESEAIEFANAIAANLASENFLGGDRLMMSFLAMPEKDGGGQSLARISVYRDGRHMVSVVRKKSGALAYAAPPDTAPGETGSKGPKPPVLLARNKLPNIYNAVYRAALNEGLDVETVNRLIRIIAFDVDFRTQITTQDRLELFLSLEEGQNALTENAEILYAGVTLGDITRQYYRFGDPETGAVDYYDETGKSAKQFLLRQPVPNGVFRSPYGMRRHPITRVRKMHWGVDWSAPRGTPILAAGNGIVEKAGWAGGSGKRTILRHANGYETYYLHQTSFAKGIKPGVRVRQGQVIGYVGSTGLSTGPHLHYEVHVNNNRVNPMKIKLPRGKVFRGEELVAFENERNRIDALLEERRLAGAQFAGN